MQSTTSLDPQIYLASSSPRRVELLEQMGVTFSLLKISVPENPSDYESCDEYIYRLSQEKAGAGVLALNEDNIIVVAADTVILFGDRILEKPKNEEDAFRMLTSLSNKRHLVKTAVSVCNRFKCETIIQTSQVTFCELSAVEISAYWKSGEPCDKAGGYAVQGRGAIFIKRIEGSYSGIMGLPIYETARLLNNFGIKLI